MNFTEFINAYNGKKIDYDGGFGVQCVDLAKMYMEKVLGIKTTAIGNAEAYWRRYNEVKFLRDNFIKIPNTPTFIPQKGDIVLWDTRHGKYGHIAVADGIGTTKYFYSYDQNWGINKAIHRVKHNYKGGFAGVLRPLAQDKVNGKYKFKLGDIVEVNVEVVPTGSLEKSFGNSIMQVDSNGYQFWIWTSEIKNGYLKTRARIIGIENNVYKLEVYPDRIGQKGNYFDCIEKYMKKA